MRLLLWYRCTSNGLEVLYGRPIGRMVASGLVLLSQGCCPFYFLFYFLNSSHYLGPALASARYPSQPKDVRGNAHERRWIQVLESPDFLPQTLLQTMYVILLDFGGRHVWAPPRPRPAWETAIALHAGRAYGLSPT
ncbi:hypothetical protein GQ53DRAFT_88227 [Thozetella sp. PMI_491]|nr:hypothetical protein GQ53DRAFT_88227 [Thozetella sp. PMI_491]